MSMVEQTPIPDEIMEQARALRGAVLWESNSSIQQIALALLAAEKRGEERERERAVKILIGIADEIAKQALNKSETQLGRSIASCAAAIRSGT